MKKQGIALMLALCTLCMLTLPACAAEQAGSVEQASPAPLFTDVPSDAWYAAAVSYCTQQGWMRGTADAAFSPSAPISRSMLAAIFHRMAGDPAPASAADFSDATPGAWYETALSWAAQAGILSGYGDGTFGIEDSVTREQVAVVLWRYAASPAAEVSERFADAASISGWALPAVNWARAGGVMNGKTDNRFDPQAPVTRAEAAVILYHYMEGAREPAPPSASRLVASISGKDFPITLEDNASTRALLERLPLTVTMGELNGNEKFYYLPDDLPADASTPEAIQTGDLMLYGSDCLVLFYKSFSSAYSYTRLGRVDDPAELAQAVGNGDVQITFQVRTA